MESREAEYSVQEKRLKERISKIGHPLIVMSGKGGVGKSTVAVNLAYALSLSGNMVGILDIDLHGPNIAKMLGIEKQSIFALESGIEPVEVSKNLKAVSIALSGYSPDQPIIWRGPAKSAVIRQFLSDVNWGELDYLVIDSPPGTGDEPLSACQLVPNVSGIIIVTTPQDVAILDARKSVLFAREIKIPVVGVIENMSGFICPHCHTETDIFKKGGGEKAARELKIPFLGRVPFEPEFVEFGDKGTPFVSFEHKSKSAEAFIEIVARIKEFVGDNQ
ncbi:MAG: Mrp/NBP35 family ATP-binding protein [Candidatus Omnitrophica bacterium]|nr:Mrp/NBP35 family ATP-binding protein [Candidatus Omnitrophota bacterium]MDD5592280.1 Mrp/NBP35 family ATP-binding protein [Candidatus Omnitrophota bacterium]